MRTLIVTTSSLLILALGAGFFAYRTTLSPNAGSTLTGKGPVREQDLSNFVARAQLVLPVSAIAVKFHHPFGFHDDQMFLCVEITPADLSEFLTQNGLDTELRNTTRQTATVVFGSFLESHPTKFREGQKELPNGDWLNVLVDEDDESRIFIYLTWFQV